MVIEDLNELSKEELLAVAEQFGTDAKRSMSKPVIIAALNEDGVTPELVNEQNAALEDYDPREYGVQPLAPGESLEDEEAEETDEDLVLVKMTRTNRTYQIRGYTFTTAHPFALVTEDDADYLIEVDGGFQMASPKEAKLYYS